MLKQNLIVGGTYGFGKEIALFLLNRDEKVATVSRSSSANLYTRHSTTFDNNHQHIKYDILKSNDLTSLHERLSNVTRHLDTLVITPALPQLDSSSLLSNEGIEYFRTMIELNFWSQLKLLTALLPLLKKSTNPMVLFFTSTAGWSNNIGWGQYNISKSLLNSLIFNLGAETEQWEKKIKIFGINPWEAKTKMNAASNISSSHIIPAFSALLKEGENYASGTIFTPDGNTHTFLEQNTNSPNLFSLYNSRNYDKLEYVREKYIINCS